MINNLTIECKSLGVKCCTEGFLTGSLTKPGLICSAQDFLIKNFTWISSDIIIILR